MSPGVGLISCLLQGWGAEFEVTPLSLPGQRYHSEAVCPFVGASTCVFVNAFLEPFEISL